MRGNQRRVAVGPDSKLGQARLVFAAGGIDEMRLDDNVVARGKFGEHLRGEVRIGVVELVEIFNTMRGTGFYALGFGAGTAARAFCRIGRLIRDAANDKAQPAWRVHDNFRVRVFLRFYRRNFGH